MKIFLVLIIIIFNFEALAKNENKIDLPSWYLSPKQNNSESLYGVAQGYSLEESTRLALADLAAKLMVSISSESSLIREENQNSANEEIRQNIKQNIEKINFSNFKVTKNVKNGETFFTEVEVERSQFISEQKEQVEFLELQVANLEKNLSSKNTIQQRNNLIKILDLEKEIELKSRILSGAGVDINLKEKLSKIASFKDKLNSLSDKIEFYITPNSPNEIAKIIRLALNKEKLKVVQNHNPKNQNELTLNIKSSSKNNKIYGAFMTKIEIDFESSIDRKTIASNIIEVSGSSSINENESYSAALKNLEEEIEKNGILKITGILTN